MAFAGIVRFDGDAVASDAEHRLSNILAAQTEDRVLVHRARDAVIVRRRTDSTTRGPKTQVNFTCGGAHALFAATARLDNRDELASSLGIARADWPNISDAALLARMLERQGEAGIARCLGAFSFACWNGQERRLILGRDCLGHRSVFFYRNDHFAVFSDIMAVLLALPNVPRELDEIVVADLIAHSALDPRRTFYRGIERTPSRCLVTVRASGAAHRAYWEPNLAANPAYRRDEDYVERARELFDQAVAAAISGEDQIAISTSGGLDSSAIAATVARLGATRRVTCYTLVPPPDRQVDVGPYSYLDESGKVAALQRLYPQIDFRFHVCDRFHPNYTDAGYFARTQIPSVGPFHLPFQLLAWEGKVADGHSVVLQGRRGNLGLTWSGAYALQVLLRAGKLRQFAYELFALSRANGRGLPYTFARNFLLPVSPKTLRRGVYLLKGQRRTDLSDLCSLNSDFIAEHDLQHRWEELGANPRWEWNGWSSAQVRIRGLFDNNGPQRDSTGFRRPSDNIDLRDPHADRRLLEFALSVPEPMYRRNGVARSFARAVFADRLPQEILRERRRGSSPMPWFRYLDAQRHQFASEIERFESSALARRLLDVPRLRRLLDEWPEDEVSAERRGREYKLVFSRGMHVGRFICWVEGGNA